MAARSALRMAWGVGTALPVMYVVGKHGVAIVPYRPANDKPLQLRVVVAPLGQRLLSAIVPRAGPGDCVLVRSLSHGGQHEWHTLVASKGEIVETKTGLVEFVTGPRVWVEADEDCARPAEQDSTQLGPQHQSLVEGVARAVVWPMANAQFLWPPYNGHPRNKGSEIDVGGGIVLRNFDAPQAKADSLKELRERVKDTKERILPDPDSPRD